MLAYNFIRWQNWDLNLSNLIIFWWSLDRDFDQGLLFPRARRWVGLGSIVLLRRCWDLVDPHARLPMRVDAHRVMPSMPWPSARPAATLLGQPLSIFIGQLTRVSLTVVPRTDPTVGLLAYRPEFLVRVRGLGADDVHLRRDCLRHSLLNPTTENKGLGVLLRLVSVRIEVVDHLLSVTFNSSNVLQKFDEALVLSDLKGGWDTRIHCCYERVDSVFKRGLGSLSQFV